MTIEFDRVQSMIEPDEIIITSLVAPNKKNGRNTTIALVQADQLNDEKKVLVPSPDAEAALGMGTVSQQQRTQEVDEQGVTGPQAAKEKQEGKNVNSMKLKTGRKRKPKKRAGDGELRRKRAELLQTRRRGVDLCHFYVALMSMDPKLTTEVVLCDVMCCDVM